MAAPLPPTVYVQKFKGAGQAQVFSFLAGVTLGAQAGTDYGALETNVVSRTHTRVIEAFGYVFSAQAPYIYRKPAVGGVWTNVHTTNVQTVQETSGLHLLHPGGKPVLAMLHNGPAVANAYLTYTYDGENWTTTVLGTNAYPNYSGDSVAFRDSIFWVIGQNTANTFCEYNFLTSAYIQYSVPDEMNRGVTLCVCNNTLWCISGAGSSGLQWLLSRFSGGSFGAYLFLTTQSPGNDQEQIGAFIFPDGYDLILILPGRGWPWSGTTYGTAAWRYSLNGGPSLDITNPVIPSGIRNTQSSNTYDNQQWEGLIDNNSNPGVPPTVHLWYALGPNQVGTRTSYTFQYRAITFAGGYDSGGPFVVGETVTGSLSGATGIVHDVDVPGNKVHLTYVVGVFNDGSVTPETLTGSESGATATSTTALQEQPLRSNGTSISSDFAIPWARDSIGPYIPTYPAVRIELGITGVLLTHGSVTNGPFALGETITGAGGAAGILMVDNTGTLVVYPTNATAFINGEVITGSASGASATLSSGPLLNQPIPPHEVIGGRKHYFRVYGSAPDPCTAALYIGMGELSPWERQTILSVALEVGAPPGVTPTVFEGAIINLPADDGARVWSLVWDADPAIIPAGTVYELAMNGT